MKIRIGYEIAFNCVQATPVLLTLNVHSSCVSSLITPDKIVTEPRAPMKCYLDSFGNWITRLTLPPGDTTITNGAIVSDDGKHDPVNLEARQWAVEDLPDDTLVYLLGSRYCETDLLTSEAWRMFGNVPDGWHRVQAICDYVHDHIVFGYEHASSTLTASEVYQSKAGVCRDYTHLAITFCRALNIPARYCTGYLSDIGEEPPYPPMDFAAWFEAFIGGQWYIFDPRNNERRIGRILMARGRDAADVSLSNSFGPAMLKSFAVHVNEVEEFATT